MFQPTSRYYSIETVTITAVRWAGHRVQAAPLLPQSDTLATLAELTVAQGDRLDVITARTLGDPEQFWRVCDANQALDPFALTAEIGSSLRIPIPRL